MNLFTRFFQENQEKFLAFAYKQKRIMPMLRWTARIATVTIIGYFITSDFRYNKEIQLQTTTVPAEQRAQIILADGMRVWLNSKYTMKYATNFGRNERNVELDGETYFEVAKNKKTVLLMNIYIEKRDYTVLKTPHSAASSVDWKNAIT
jgi:Fe2+-dicitrate sensor, membrane component